MFYNYLRPRCIKQIKTDVPDNIEDLKQALKKAQAECTINTQFKKEYVTMQNCSIPSVAYPSYCCLELHIISLL